MCQHCYTHQLQFLVSTGALDTLCFLIRIYCYIAKTDISGWLKSSSVSGDKDGFVLAGFVLDFIGCLIPASSLIVMFLLMLGNCCRNYGTSRFQSGEFYASIGQQPIRRMLTMRCNCPCYRTRPKLRFIVRVVLIALCILLHMIASILYSQGGRYLLVILCAASIAFLLVSLAFDLYHYHVWWYYRPSNDKDHTKYSSKHRRFLPYHLLGDNRNPMTLGNEPCSSDPCTNRELEHILIYHNSAHQPQQRWFEVSSENIYIGFHRTSGDAAIKIAHSDMKPSTTPPQMLGFGIYFARSIKDTQGKARAGLKGGGIICAKIRMESTDAWHKDFDTIYYKHIDERQDEFCIKSPDQILEWVMVIEEACDTRVKNLGLSVEFSDTRCGCI